MFLRCAIQDSLKTWSSWLSLVELSYNSTFHTSIGCSPFKALYGYEPKVGDAPVLQPTTPPTIAELVENQELHLQSEGLRWWTRGGVKSPF
jgi:hypothetical protein